MVSRARTLGKAKDFSEGTIVLDELEATIAKALAEKTSGVNPATVQTALADWQSTIDTAVEQISGIETSLNAFDAAASKFVARVLSGIVANFPDGVDRSLENLLEITKANHSESISGHLVAVHANAKSCLKYLQQHKKYIHACEDNPFTGKREIAKPVGQSLQRILASLK